MTTPATKARLEDIALGDLRASATNPRKTFAPGPLQELADSIRAQGIRQPILVRPKAGETPFEIVAGERRYRAAKLAELALVPCLVSEMSDREAIEVQAVENLQREDLTELEEAASYQMMLDMRDEQTGAPVYTAERLAERFGKERTHIYRRLTLLRLPEAGRKALEAGKLPATVAVYVARIPSPEAQTAALEKILTPETQKGPLSAAETRELIARDFMQGLKGAPFKLDDAELLPAAGPCATCPKMSDNCAHLFSPEEAEQFKKKKVCTDPTCYRAKLDALWKQRTAAAEAEGKIVLDEKQSRAIFPDREEAGAMAYDSPYVFLSDKPEAYLLKPEVMDNVGTWRRLVEDAEAKTAELALAEAKARIQKDPDLSREEKRDAIALLEKTPPSGMSVPRVLARDQTGAAREIVDRTLAITAIEASGEPIFFTRASGLPTGGGDAFAKERKAQQEAAKQRLAENIIALDHVHSQLIAKWEPSGIWEGLFPIAMDHAGFDGAWLLAKWKGLKVHGGGTGEANVYDVVGAWAAELVPSERQALVPILLQGARLKNSGPSDELETFCQAAGLELDFKAVAKQAKEDLRSKTKEKKKPTPEVAPDEMAQAEAEARASVQAAKETTAKKNKRVQITPEIEEAVRALVIQGMSHAEIAKRVCISLPSVQNIKKRLGLVIPGALEAARCAEWVKARANGMSVESIASSYNTTPEDVRGALELDKGTTVMPAPSPIPGPADLAPAIVQQLLGYDDAKKSIEEMAYLTHLPRDTVRAALRAAGRPVLGCDLVVDCESEADAHEKLKAAIKAALPGVSESALGPILASYAKRVCGAAKPVSELTPAECLKIVDILAKAKMGRGDTKAKVTTASEQEAA